MQQSEKLTQFYREYLKWVESGAPTDHHCFERKYGLCANLASSCESIAVSGTLLEELITQFEDAGLTSAYPFDADIHAYKVNMEKLIHHLNPNRIQWVRDHINMGDAHEAV